MLRVFFATSVIAHGAAVLNVHTIDHDTSAGQHRSSEPVQIVMKNVDDMSYVSSIKVGGQQVETIMDTGSFEIVLFSKTCSSCGVTENFFDPSDDDDTDFNLGDLSAMQQYGSGSTTSQEAYDKIQLKSLKTGRQMFWLATDANMDFMLDGTFAGIFGLGPPSSAYIFAEEDVAYLEEALADASNQQQKEYQDYLNTYKDVANLLANTTLWHTQNMVRIFSICLRPEVGKNGMLTFHDNIDYDSLAFGTDWLNVSGEFWQLPITSVSVNEDVSWAGDCDAVLDSGTSLIGVPEDFYDALANLVEAQSIASGCDDVTGWPDFTFTLHNTSFKLAATSYVGRYLDSDFSFLDEQNGTASEEAPMQLQTVARRMPHLKKFRALRQEAPASQPDTFCAPAVFKMDEMEGQRCSWLFGLPFFREYYTTHRLSSNYTAAEALRFTKADGDCNPEGPSEVQKQLAPPPLQPLIVNPRKIRFPRSTSHRRHEFLRRAMLRASQ